MPWRKPLFTKSHEVPFARYKRTRASVWLGSLQALLDRTPSSRRSSLFCGSCREVFHWAKERPRRQPAQDRGLGGGPSGTALGSPQAQGWRWREHGSGTTQGEWCREDPQPTPPPQPKITSGWHQGVTRTWVLQRWQTQGAPVFSQTQTDPITSRRGAERPTCTSPQGAAQGQMANNE